jgi:nitrite reductase/ring-hydroxylating ferredoxin subunit
MMSWWCVAWSDELKDKPLAVRVGGEEIVLFRDASGVAKACEDRCPHRRVPLSMGWVTSTGAIQCGYHGWAYNGSTGQCVAIPNFRPDEPISPRVKVQVYETAEVNGAIFVEAGSEAEQARTAPTIAAASGAAEPVSGESVLDLAHEAWVESLISNPPAALGLADLQLDGSGARTESGAGSIVVEQKVRSSKIESVKQPLTARFEVWALTGLAQLVVRDGAGAVRINVVVSSLPLGERQTRVRWRLLDGAAGGLFASVLRKLRGPAGSESISIRADVPKVQHAEEVILQWRDLRSDEQHLAHQIRVGEEG